MNPIRLMVIESERLFGALLRSALSEDPRLDVVGVSTIGPAAMQRTSALQPDAVLLDVPISGEIGGLEMAARIKDLRPETGIVILASHAELDRVASASLEPRPGYAYLVRQSIPDLDALVRAIEAAIAGMVVVDPAIINSVRPGDVSPVALLSQRQRQVLELIAQGYSNAAVAGQLVLKEKSVETYINGIYQVLGVSGHRDIHARVKATVIYLEYSRTRISRPMRRFGHRSGGTGAAPTAVRVPPRESPVAVPLAPLR